jgi:hypothetical protein
VRHKDERQAEFFLQQLELDLHLLAQLSVERAQRFVEQQHCRPLHERARQRHPLLLTARKLVRATLREMQHLDAFEGVANPPVALRPPHPVAADPIGDVLGRRHVREQRVVLEHGVHIPPVGRHQRHVLAPERDGAIIGKLEPADHAQHGGLPRTRRPQQGHE